MNTLVEVGITRNAPQYIRELFLENGILLQEHPIVATQYISFEIEPKIFEADAWVFTSSVAIQRFIDLNLFNQYQGFVYSIEGHSSTLIESQNKQPITAPNSKELAIKMVENGLKNAVYFTTQWRLDHLESLLHSKKISLDIVEVYQKIPQPEIIPNYPFLTFFSPSQVQVYLEKNSWNSSMKIISWGPTTSHYLQQVHAPIFAELKKPSWLELLQIIQNNH